MTYLRKGLVHPLNAKNCSVAALAALTFCLGAPTVGSAETYRLSDGFSAFSNPSGSWSFGYVTNIGAPFHLLQVPHVSPTDGLLIPSWQLTSYQTPAVYFNGTANTAVIAGGQGVFPPQTVWYYPGEDGRPENFGVIRFTAPASGTYQLETAVSAVYNGSLSGDTDFHVAINGLEAFGRFIPKNGSTGYTNSVTLNGGDVVDFVIGRGADGSSYASGLKIYASLTLPSVPPASDVFDVAEGFSAGSNPNAPWAYGWAGNLGGTFTPLSVPHISNADGGAKIPSWRLTSFQTPAVYKNTSNVTVSAGGGLVSFPAGEIWYYPGENGRPENFGVIRFTAPSNGLYQIATSVRPVYSASPQGDTDFHVLKNGAELFGQFLAPSDTASYSNTVALNSGDTVDFTIGRGSDGNAFGSGLRIAAVLKASPLVPPAVVGFDLSKGFSALNNPAGVWSYGWKGSLGGSFSLLLVKHLSPSANGVVTPSWQLTSFQTPAVYNNPTTNTAVLGANLGRLDPGAVIFFPGENGRPENFGVIRFTAPSNGVYAIDSAFAPVYDGAPQGDTDIHILKDGLELFGEYLLPSGRTSFSNTVELLSGQSIDFAIGRGADGSQYGSGLKIRAAIIPILPLAPPQNEFVVNGSFEIGMDPGSSSDIAGPNSTAITGWTVENASVDYIGARWAAGDGVRCLDLSGTDAGTISQMIEGLTPGQAYRLSFLMAANPEVAPYTSRLRAAIGSASSEFTFNQPGITTGNLGWTEKTLDFVASASEHKLSFISLNPGWAGAALDKVAIVVNTNLPPEGSIDIAIANHSFELPVLPDGGITSSSVPGWVGEGTHYQVSNPTDGWFNGTSQGSAGQNPIDGANIGGMNNATRLYQDLQAVYLPNRKYTLTLLVGTRKSVPFGVPKVRLKSGDTLAAEALPSAPPQGEFAPFSMQFDTPDSGGVVGLPIRIEFQGLGGDAQWWLDNVRLVASPSVVVTNPPQPAALVLNGSFELGENPGSSTDIQGPNSTAITGWTVESASVDYIGTRWVAADGFRCLDLSGTDAGTISQMVQGLTPGQFYRLSFSMAANPEVAPFAARLRASVGTTSEEFSFGPFSGSVGNLGWVRKSLDFTASASSMRLSFQSLNRGWAGAALDNVSIVVNTNPPPPNHAPLARIEVDPQYNVWPDQTNVMVIAVDGLETDIVLDGAFSSDEDGDLLSFAWTRNDEGATFALGVRTTNIFEVGFHNVTLVVDDGKVTGAATVNVEVLTLEDALDELYGVLIESEIPRKDKRPLLTTLGRVWDSFTDGRLNAGAKQLRAFQQKARAQLTGKDADAGKRMVQVAQQIIDAINSYLIDHEEPWRGEKEKGGKK